MEGKEVRFGTAASGLWGSTTTGTSNGSVNSMHDSYTPLGGGVPLTHMMLGEISPGGVGVGLSGLLVMAMLSVFIAGLMVGRTPEYLGKKIQAPEMKMVALYVLAMPTSVLAFTAASLYVPSVLHTTIWNPGQHGFTEILYAFTSGTNNNGSAFAGYTGYVQPNAGNLGAHGVTFADLLGGFDMMVARYVPILFALAVAGALAGKRISPAGLGTMRTDNPTFVVLLIGGIILVGALTFFPALLLGPLVQGLTGHLY